MAEAGGERYNWGILYVQRLFRQFVLENGQEVSYLCPSDGSVVLDSETDCESSVMES